MTAHDLDPDGRHAHMIAAAVWLADQGFARIGWATHADGKAAGSRSGNKWQSTASDDPALVPGLLRGARNALVIPTGRAIIIDIDDPDAWGELETAGLPPTLTIDSPTPDHGHVYGMVPAGIEMSTIPGAFAGGEIRRHDPITRTASMVLGPWSWRSDGVYTPRGEVRAIETLPESVIEYLIASARTQDAQRSAARGPDDDGWVISRGRHDFLVSRARNLRGVGMTGERLLEEIVRIDAERCSPPLAGEPGRGMDELRRIVGWTEEKIADDPPPIRIVSTPRVNTDDDETRHLTRQSLAALRFVERMGERVRFDHGRRRWLVWRGHRWQPDEDAAVRQLWFDVLAARYREAMRLDDDKREATIAAVQAAGATDAAVEAGIRLAASMLPVAMTGGEFDPDPWLLGCGNGLVDLHTGQLRDGRPEDLVTRSTGWEFDPTATCPRWDRFLAEVFAGDVELVGWFRRLIGASLVGTSKELLALLWGAGNNGKSVAYRTLLAVAGDYGVETLVNARRDAGGPSSDLMRLRGARLAFTSEPDQVARLKSGTLKRLATIDHMTGRELHGRQQEWAPTHTIHLATNHLPEVDDTSEGMWRRIMLVPFTVRFRKDGAPREDPTLSDTLETEAPGILAWAVRGAVEYAAGLTLHPLPAAVTAATADYRADEDPLAAYLETCLRASDGGRVTGPELFRRYESWADEVRLSRSARLGSRRFGRSFTDRYRTLDFHVRRSKVQGIITYHGLRITLDSSVEGALGVSKTPFAGSPSRIGDKRKPEIPDSDAPNAPNPLGPEDPTVEQDYPESVWATA